MGADQQRKDEPRPTINLMWCNTEKLSWTEKLILKEDTIYPESCAFDQSPVVVFNVTKPPGITIRTNAGSSCPDAMDVESKTRGLIKFLLGILVVSGIFFWGMWVREEQKWLNKPMTPMERRILKRQMAKQN